MFDSVKIYPKLIMTFLIVLAPLFVLSLLTNRYGSDNVKTEITNSMQSKVHFYNSTLENEFTRTVKLMREFAGYEDLDRLSNGTEIMTHYEKRIAIRNLQKELSFLKSSSNYILEASVHIPAIDRTLSDDDYESIPRDEFEALNVVTNIFESPFIYWRDRLFISLPYPVKANNLAPDFIVDIEISTDALKSALLQFNNRTAGSAMLIDFGKDWKISKEGEDLLTGELARAEIMGGEEQGLRLATVDGERYVIAFEKSKVLGTTLVMYEREQTVLGSLRQYSVWFWMISGLTLIVILYASYSVYRLIHKPLRTLVRAFRKVEQGNLNVHVDNRGRDEFHYLYTQFNAMVQNLQQMIFEVYEQKYRVQHAELKQLQSQINPHFLYNSLFILYRLAKQNGDENQIRFTKYLSDYFQFITRDSSNEIPLSEEVKHAKTYVDIQTFRFAHQIKVHFGDLPPSCAHLAVPRLIVQPLLENAYKHALEQRESGGELNVSFELSEGEPGKDELRVTIEDNGQRVDETTLFLMQKKLNDRNVGQETTGLINVHRRLLFRFGSSSGLLLSKGASGGLRISFSLPTEQTVRIEERIG
jgi:two-component system sensor histidine kinase YesM